MRSDQAAYREWTREWTSGPGPSLVGEEHALLAFFSRLRSELRRQRESDGADDDGEVGPERWAAIHGERQEQSHGHTGGRAEVAKTKSRSSRAGVLLAAGRGLDWVWGAKSQEQQCNSAIVGG